MLSEGKRPARPLALLAGLVALSAAFGVTLWAGFAAAPRSAIASAFAIALLSALAIGIALLATATMRRIRRLEAPAEETV